MKVAAYCRVSTGHEDQAQSYASQQRYFREYAARQPGWELVEIYADEGISGTSTKGRAAFCRMIRDAAAGRFQLILTKEISRFARNTLDSIYYTRALKQHGVGVLFVNDGIDTRKADSELYLAIKATLAQEESRAISARVKWGQARRMEQGVVFGRSLLGYCVAGGKLTVNEEGAETVRRIFLKYALEKKSAQRVARELEAEGRKTALGGTKWRPSVILKILKNEKYCGDLCQKKTVTPDFLTHRRQKNRGEEPLICLRGHHQPIVPRALWQAAQQEIARRRGLRGTPAANPLAGKVRCGLCGRAFALRRMSSGALAWRPACACGTGCQLGEGLLMQAAAEGLWALAPPRAGAEHALARALCAGLGAERQSAAQSAASCARQAAALRAKKIALLDAYLEGAVAKDDLRLMNAAYNEKLRRLAARPKPPAPPSGPEPQAEALCRAAQALWQQPEFCAALLQSLTLYPGGLLEARYTGLQGAAWFTLLPPPAPRKKTAPRKE